MLETRSAASCRVDADDDRRGPHSTCGEADGPKHGPEQFFGRTRSHPLSLKPLISLNAVLVVMWYAAEFGDSESNIHYLSHGLNTTHIRSHSRFVVSLAQAIAKMQLCRRSRCCGKPSTPAPLPPPPLAYPPLVQGSLLFLLMCQMLICRARAVAAITVLRTPLQPMAR